MLHGENFRGGHQSSLRAVFDGDDRGLQRDDGFAAAHVALQQAIHGERLFEVGGNFRERPLLRRGGFEGQNFFKRGAHAVFAHAKGNGVGAARGLPLERDAQLIAEEFVEDQALLRGRTEGVEGFRVGIGRWEMRVN